MRTAAAVVMALAVATPAKADWTGLYIAGSVGWLGGDLDWSWDIFQNVPPRQTSHASDNLAGGLHFGARRQWSQMVIGLEGSLYMFHHSAYTTEANAFQAGVDKDFESKMNWLGTITPRIGWDLGQWMAYVKGGYAVSQVALANYVSPNGEIQTLSKRHMHGWTIGGGLEWRVRKHVSLGLEYDFVRLSGDTRTDVELGVTVASSHRLGDVDIHQVMFRLNLIIPHWRDEYGLR